MGKEKEALYEAYLAAREAVIKDGKTAWKYLPDYADYETAYGTKQYYEDIFQKLKGVSEENRDCWYLLALMETKDRLFEAMFEYQAGIRDLFKAEFFRQEKQYDNLSAEEQAIFLAAAYKACRNKTILSYKYLPKLEKRYEALAETEGTNQENELLEAAREQVKEGRK